jgi:hypothetical protein
MLWDEQRDEDVDIEEADHARRPLALGETVDVLDRESRCPWTWREHGHTSLEADVGIGETPEQGRDEFVDFLPCLRCKRSNPCLQH